MSDTLIKALQAGRQNIVGPPFIQSQWARYSCVDGSSACDSNCTDTSSMPRLSHAARSVSRGERGIEASTRMIFKRGVARFLRIAAASASSPAPRNRIPLEGERLQLWSNPACEDARQLRSLRVAPAEAAVVQLGHLGELLLEGALVQPAYEWLVRRCIIHFMPPLHIRILPPRSRAKDERFRAGSQPARRRRAAAKGAALASLRCCWCWHLLI